MTLRLSRSLSLPVDVAGEATAILAKRGAGKTNTATVLVEELYAAGVQVVILDPVGSWWGIRSAADGRSDGLPIPRIGGAHADVPLEQTAGGLIADVAVDTRQSLLIDVSDFPSKAAVLRFTTDFAERLYRRKARSGSLLHVVLEEADTFAPQKPGRDGAHMQHAVEQIVRRGRARGLGITMITQRSAVLNKDVLSQADVLIAMRTTSPHDIRAISEWVNAKGDERGREVIDSLPSLETGDAWVWNPERDLLARTKIRPRRTFDSSQTPKAGGRRIEPKKAAPIDLAALGEQIQATVERAEANDPRELRRRLAETERKLAHREGEFHKLLEHASETRVEERIVEVPAVPDTQMATLGDAVERMRAVADTLTVVGGQIAEGLRAAASVHRAAEPSAKKRHTPDPVSPPTLPPSTNGDGPLGDYARGLLETVAQRHPMRPTRAQIATLSGRRPRSSSFAAAMAELVRDGMLRQQGSQYEITDAGLDIVGGDVGAPLTPTEVLERWRAALPAYERSLLDELVAAHPNGLTRQELSARTGRSMTSSSFAAAISTLAKNGVATVAAGEVRASDDLFPDRIGAA